MKLSNTGFLWFHLSKYIFTHLEYNFYSYVLAWFRRGWSYVGTHDVPVPKASRCAHRHKQDGWRLVYNSQPRFIPIFRHFIRTRLSVLYTTTFKKVSRQRVRSCNRKRQVGTKLIYNNMHEVKKDHCIKVRYKDVKHS